MTAGRQLLRITAAAASCACLFTVFLYRPAFPPVERNRTPSTVFASSRGYPPAHEPERNKRLRCETFAAGTWFAADRPAADLGTSTSFPDVAPAGHRPVLLAIASRKRRVARRRQIRRLLFGVKDNLRPCPAQLGPVYYRFLVFDEPRRSTSVQPKLSFDEERAYRTDLIENDDIVELRTVWIEGDRNSTGGNVLERQAAVLDWVARVGDTVQPISYDHAIVTDDLTFLRLDIILQTLFAKRICLRERPITLNDEESVYLLWGSTLKTGALGTGIARTFVVGRMAVELLASSTQALLEIMGTTKMTANTAAVTDLPEDVWDMFIRSRPESDGRVKVEVVHDSRFVAWENRLDIIADDSLVIGGVYQDEELLDLAEHTGGPRPVPVCGQRMGKPGTIPADFPSPSATQFANLSIAVATSSYIYGDSCMLEAGVAAARNKRSYAARHDHAFVARSAEFAQQATRSPPRKAVWGKIDAVEKVLPYYDWLLWVDMDAVVVDLSRSVGSILQGLHGNQQRLLQKNGKPKDLIIAQPAGNSMANAGVFLIRNSHWSRGFLREVQARRTQYWGKMYEQRAIWDVILDPRWAPGVLHLRDDDHTFNTFPNRFRPGDFIVHYAPQACPAAEIIRTVTSGQVVAGDGRFVEGWPRQES